MGILLIAAKVALVPLIFDASVDMPFVVPKAVVGQGLSLVLGAVLLGAALRFGRVILLRTWLHVPVLMFLLVSGLAAVLASNVTVAIVGTHARMLGLLSLADCVVLYGAVAILVRTRADAVAIAAATLVASGVVLSYEGIQVAGRDPFDWSIDSATRPFSTFGQATVLAQYLTVLAVGVFAFALLRVAMPLWARVAAFSYASLLLIGATATGTRAGIIGLLSGILVLVALTWITNPSPRLRLGSLLSVAALSGGMALALVATPLGPRLFATVVESGSDDEDLITRLEPSAAGRLVLYEIGLGMIRDRPVLGYGPDNFVTGIPAHRPVRAPVPYRDNLASSAHSWAVQVGSSSGLVGLALFVGIAVGAIVLAARRPHNPVAIAGAAMLASFLGTGLTTVNEIGTDWLFWLSAATVAVSTGTLRSTVPHGTHGRQSKANRAEPATMVKVHAASAMLIGAAVLAIWAGATALEASRANRESQQARLVGRSVAAVDAGLRATRLIAHRAEYWHALGLAYSAAARRGEAALAFERASVLAPHNVRYLGDFTRALIIAAGSDRSVGERARALGELAIRLDPNNPTAHLTRALVMQLGGDSRESARSVDRALALDPNSVNRDLYVTAAQVLTAVGRAAEAVEVSRRGIVVFGAAASSVPIRIELARALSTTGRHAEAIAELDIALVINPREAAAERLREAIRANLPKTFTTQRGGLL